MAYYLKYVFLPIFHIFFIPNSIFINIYMDLFTFHLISLKLLIDPVGRPRLNSTPLASGKRSNHLSLIHCIYI